MDRLIGEKERRGEGRERQAINMHHRFFHSLQWYFWQQQQLLGLNSGFRQPSFPQLPLLDFPDFPVHTHTQNAHTPLRAHPTGRQLLLSVSGASRPISALLQINYGLSAWLASVISLPGSRSDGLSWVLGRRSTTVWQLFPPQPRSFDFPTPLRPHFSFPPPPLFRLLHLCSAPLMLSDRATERQLSWAS